MGNITVLFARAGLAAALGLSVFDFITSMMGIRQIMGPGDRGLIVTFMPMLFAMLALCFNAVSAHIFRMYLQRGFGSFASSVTFCMWAFFLTYDAISSLIGILSCYTSAEIGSFEAGRIAFASLRHLAAFFVVVMAALLSFGPFLCSVFSDLIKNDQ